MTENVHHAPVKVDGQIVGLASADFTEEGAMIFMKINHTEAGRKVWDMLNDDDYGYSFNDEVEEDDTDDDMTFQQELAQVINRHSRENASGTPDFVLAAYLEDCLETYERAIKSRGNFRGESIPYKPGNKITLIDYGPSIDGMGSIETFKVLDE